MMESEQLARIREAIRGEGLDGWLFYNFRHRDRLADEILGLDSGSTSTRPWAYAVPARGVPLKIVHGIEARTLDALAGDTVRYVDRETFFRSFDSFAGQKWAAHVSGELPILSFLDAGTAERIRAAGLDIVSAAPLVQRLKGLLDDESIASHERSARALYEIVRDAWEAVDEAYRSGTVIGEGSVRTLLLEGMEKRGIETDHPPIVAAGGHSGDPHYDFAGEGEAFREGDVVQLDLWAKETRPGSIYADISWVGVFGREVDAEVQRAWGSLVRARDEAVSFAAAALTPGAAPTGADVDARVRAVLIEAGYGDAIRHRTGHGIDTECHGSGVNLDSIEFPDRRRLLEGSCFSVEPGLYFQSFGLRTEIDVYIRGGVPRISGGEPQRKILRCGRSAH